jgi:hypothetical protein
MDRFIWRGSGAAPGSGTGTGDSRPATGHGGRRTNSGRRRAIDQPPHVDQPSAFGGSAGGRDTAPAFQLLYEAMMYYQFLHLATKGIMYGTFVNSMNEMKRIAYTKDHISYLDHWLNIKFDQQK